jgi:nucleotidyltransferase substrate binding protein (TIGR01987 family)
MVVIVRAPKDALAEAFKLGWLADDLVFLEMLHARNQMSHEYDEAEARKVFRRIKKRFIKPLEKLLARLSTLS